MSLAVCSSAFIRRECGLRLSVVVDALDGRRCGDSTNHAESDAPSERYRYTVARETPSIFAMSVAAMPSSRRVRILAASASSTCVRPGLYRVDRARPATT
jgi:hypothetical protein